MVITTPGADDGTRLGLIDVGVPRCICWRLVRTTGLLFYWCRRDAAGKPAGLKTGATKPFAGVSPRSKRDLEVAPRESLRSFN
jgi:hypothetical protein